MLFVATFKWASPRYKVRYTADHVNVLESMVRRHYRGDLRFICITDDPTGIEGDTFPLWDDCGQIHNACGEWLPSCYRRLKLFDPATQKALGLRRGDRIVNLDLDTVIVDDLNPLWDRDEPFIGWAIRGTHHPRVFNGSMWMVKAGAEAHVWRKFDPMTSPKEAKAAKFLGSDQSWMSYRLQGRAGWGESDGVYSYPQQLRKSAPPPGARVVMFHGFKKPWMEGLPAWVGDHYRRSGKGRCIVLGYGETVWQDAAEAIQSDYDGVIASPEAAEMWPHPVTAIAYSDDEAISLARVLGFDEIAMCGRTIMGVAA